VRSDKDPFAERRATLGLVVLRREPGVNRVIAFHDLVDEATGLAGVEVGVVVIGENVQNLVLFGVRRNVPFIERSAELPRYDTVFPRSKLRQMAGRG
jgi:hypothetical protein